MWGGGGGGLWHGSMSSFLAVLGKLQVNNHANSLASAPRPCPASQSCHTLLMSLPGCIDLRQSKSLYLDRLMEETGSGKWELGVLEGGGLLNLSLLSVLSSGI